MQGEKLKQEGRVGTTWGDKGGNNIAFSYQCALVGTREETKLRSRRSEQPPAFLHICLAGRHKCLLPFTVLFFVWANPLHTKGTRKTQKPAGVEQNISVWVGATYPHCHCEASEWVEQPNALCSVPLKSLQRIFQKGHPNRSKLPRAYTPSPRPQGREAVRFAKPPDLPKHHLSLGFVLPPL